jgi:hypothetical protein
MTNVKMKIVLLACPPTYPPIRPWRRRKNGQALWTFSDPVVHVFTSRFDMERDSILCKRDIMYVSVLCVHSFDNEQHVFLCTALIKWPL